jgi:acyl-CoA thioesterase FadM
MLSHLFRVGFILLWHSLLKKKLAAGELHRQRLRAWPWRCDTYRHVNNATVLRLAEDSRWAWTVACGLFGRSVKERWMFLVGGVDVIYRRSIPLMASFEVKNRVVGADETWLYLSQEFVLPSGKVAARVLLRATIKSRGQTVRPSTVLSEVGIEVPASRADVQAMKALGALQLAEIS